MKMIIATFLITVLNSAWAQIDREIDVNLELTDPFRIKSYYSEIPPKFPGTKREMLDFIELRFQFTPEMVRTELYELELYLQVDVDEDGKVLDIHDLRNRKENTALFKEVKRIFLLMPNWIPGKTKGKDVKSSTRVNYKKPIVFAYGNEFASDTLVYNENQTLDTTHIYSKPQIRPQQKYNSLEYNYLMSLKFNYPNELIKDSIIGAFTYECLIDEFGNSRGCTLVSNSSSYPILDSISFENMKNLPKYEPASIDGVPVKCTVRVGHFVYPPDYFVNGKHKIRKTRSLGRYYQSSEQGLRKHFEENFIYPEDLRKEPKFGTVYVSLEADEDGELKFCYVLFGINPLIDKEVVRVLNQSAQWTYINYTQPYTKGQAIIVAIRISERHVK